MMSAVNNIFLKSALSITNCLHNINEIKLWITKKRAETFVKVSQISIKELKDWKFDDNQGVLKHVTGGFFSIQGINVKTNWGDVEEWEQPIINQPEIGYLGIITKEINGVLYFLLQSKIEPGNINHVQLSPTLQATKSNYELKHKGKTPLYLEYFQNVKKNEILLDQLQSEQGARFLRKRNRNIIIKIEEEIKVYENFIWVTLGQIKELLKIDNIINMDTRTVISGITFNEINTNYIEEFNKKNNFNINNINSYLNSSYSKHTFDEILNWITKHKCYYELQITQKPIKEIKKWNINHNEIVHVDNLYFKIIGTEIQINNREVKTWNQPLIVPLQTGVFAFIIKNINNTIHFLVQAKVEPGNFDIIELAPTVQCITGSYADTSKVPFLNFILNSPNKSILYDTLQSEEGGRFYKEENRNMIIEVNENFKENIPENFMWISFNQLTLFLKFNNYLNIQSRSLISSIQFI